MININIFAENGDPDSILAAYCWPQGELPCGKIAGCSGNALLMKLADGAVAVISAPIAEVSFNTEGLPLADLKWAFE